MTLLVKNLGALANAEQFGLLVKRREDIGFQVIVFKRFLSKQKRGNVRFRLKVGESLTLSSKILLHHTSPPRAQVPAQIPQKNPLRRPLAYPVG